MGCCRGANHRLRAAAPYSECVDSDIARRLQESQSHAEGYAQSPFESLFGLPHTIPPRKDQRRSPLTYRNYLRSPPGRSESRLRNMVSGFLASASGFVVPGASFLAAPSSLAASALSFLNSASHRPTGPTPINGTTTSMTWTTPRPPPGCRWLLHARDANVATRRHRQASFRDQQSLVAPWAAQAPARIRARSGSSRSPLPSVRTRRPRLQDPMIRATCRARNQTATPRVR